MYVGCDPGVSGALAFFDKKGRPVRVMDMPIRPRQRGKGNEVDASDLYLLLSKHSTAYAALEYANAAPMQGRRPGTQSMFNFGESYGIARSLLELQSQSVILVVPADWKAHFGLLRQEKDAVRLKAIERWPTMADSLNLKKHHGRADALFIGAYLMETRIIA